MRVRHGIVSIADVEVCICIGILDGMVDMLESVSESRHETCSLDVAQIPRECQGVHGVR